MYHHHSILYTLHKMQNSNVGSLRILSRSVCIPVCRPLF
jgi:hypothetical protein